MHEFERRFGGKPRKHVVYSQEEADNHESPIVRGYVHWPHVKPGAWGLTDDGHVAECIRIAEYRKRTVRSTDITFSFCRVFVKRDVLTGQIKGEHRLEFMPYAEQGGFGERRPGATWVERETRRPRAVRAVRLYARFLVGNSHARQAGNKGRSGELTEDQWSAVGAAYRPDQERPVATAKRLFKSPEVQTMVQQEIAKLFGLAGIEKVDVIKFYEEIRQNAMATQPGQPGGRTLPDLKMALEVVDRYRDLLMPPEPPEQAGSGYLEAYGSSMLLDGGDDVEDADVVALPPHDDEDDGA